MATEKNDPTADHTDATPGTDANSGTEGTEPTETVDRVDATRAIEVEEPEAVRRQGVADLLGDDEDQPATGHAPAMATREVPAATVAADASAATIPDAPAAPSGPHVPGILLGVICLAVAGLVLAQELGDLTLDWGDIGPLGIALTGGVLVLFGLLGLVTSRRKDA